MKTKYKFRVHLVKLFGTHPHIRWWASPSIGISISRVGNPYFQDVCYQLVLGLLLWQVKFSIEEDYDYGV